MACNYKTFSSNCKLEHQVANHIKISAKAADFLDWRDPHASNRLFIPLGDSACALVKIGEVNSIESNGFNIIATHTDSPRIELKSIPLIECSGSQLLKTCYYGDIKKYQWVVRPLALMGELILTDGSIIEVSIGNKPNEPCFTITDLLPHLSSEQMKKTAASFIGGEDLSVLVGLASSKEGALNNLSLKLSEVLGLDSNKIISSFNLSLLPAGSSCDVGFKSELIGGYGHDARSCVYATLQAFLNNDVLSNSSNMIAIFFDSEEKGSFGRNSAQSNVMEYIFSILQRVLSFDFSFTLCMRSSKAIVADVAVAIDPIHDEVSDPINSARLGCGVCVSKYTGGNGQFGGNRPSLGLLNKIIIGFNKSNIRWQFHEISKTDRGGGGTISKHLARLGIDTIDIGPAVLSMHSPFEIISKEDLESSIAAYIHFFVMD